MNDRIQGPIARFERVIVSEDPFDHSHIHSISSEKYPNYEGEILTSHSNFQDCVFNLIPSPDFDERLRIHEINVSVTPPQENNNTNTNNSNNIANNLIRIEDNIPIYIQDHIQKSITMSPTPHNSKKFSQNDPAQDTIITTKAKAKIQRRTGTVTDIDSTLDISKNPRNGLAAQRKPQMILDLKLITQLRKKMLEFRDKFTITGRRKFLSSHRIRHSIDDSCDVNDIMNKESLPGRCPQAIIIASIAFTLHSLKLLSPHSKTSTFLKGIFVFYNMIYFLVLSIEIIFQIDMGDVERVVEFLTQFVWLGEIFVQLNTKVYVQTELVNQREEITQKYLSYRVWYDVIPFIVLIWSNETSSHLQIALRVISFIKLRNVNFDINELQQQFCIMFENYYLIQLVNLIIKLFIVGHIIACTWYLIGQIELNWIGEEETWYSKGLGADGVWWKLYLESFYWALTLMTTGSNVADTLLQMSFTTFIMLFTTILTGYLLNVTGIIISQFDEADEHKRLDLSMLNEHMRANKVSSGLRTRVNFDLQYYYANDMNRREQIEEKERVIAKLSPHLQALLKLEFCEQIISKINIIREKFSSDTIAELSNSLVEDFYLPNQKIFEPCTSSSSSNINSEINLIYVLQGQIEIEHISSTNRAISKGIHRINKGEIVGQENFFSGLAYDTTARSTQFTKVIKISRDRFLEIVSERGKDREVFCAIRDSLLAYENFEVADKKCCFCLAATHREIDCNLVHVHKNDMYQRVRFTQSITNPSRAEFDRKSEKVHKSWYNFKTIHKEVRHFRHAYKSILLQDFKKIQKETAGGGAEEEEENPQEVYIKSQILSDYEDDDEEYEEDSITSEPKSFKPDLLSSSPGFGGNNSPSSPKKSALVMQESYSIIPSEEGIQNKYVLRSSARQVSYANDSNLYDPELNSPDRSEDPRSNSINNYPINSNNLIKTSSPKFIPKLLRKPTYGEDVRLKATQIYRQLSKNLSKELDPKAPEVQAIMNAIQETVAKQRSLILQDKMAFSGGGAGGGGVGLKGPSIDDNKMLLTTNDNFIRKERSLLLSELWDFDRVQDYKFYFAKGNSKFVIVKYNRYQRKRHKSIKRLRISK